MVSHGDSKNQGPVLRVPATRITRSRDLSGPRVKRNLHVWWSVVSGIILYYVLLSYNFHPKEILAYRMLIISLR